jgi:hypothetical protein
MVTQRARLGHAADRCAGSTKKVKDDDPTVRVIVVVFGSPRTSRHPVERKLQPRLALLAMGSLLLFPLPNLFDDERR